MTQPPDDAALVARLILESARLHFRSTEARPLMERAATALEAKDRRIAELEAALRNVRYEAERDHGGLVHLKRAIATATRAALEPSDKGVGR